MRPEPASAFVCCLALLIGGCGDVRPFATLEKDPSFPGVPDDASEHAGLFAHPALLTGCAVSNPMDLGVRTELRIFIGASVADADVQLFLGSLQRYYSQYGVKMFTRHDPIRLPFDDAMTFDMSVLSAEVKRETGVDLSDASNLPQAEIERATASLGRAILYNVRELIRVYGEPRRPVLNLVLLDEMVSQPLSAEFAEFQGIAGLGLSPEGAVRQDVGDPEERLRAWLNVGEAFTPIALVGIAPVKAVLSEPDVVVAHEVAHAYGLGHSTDAGNLMNPSSAHCSLELDAAQLATIRGAAEMLDAP